MVITGYGTYNGVDYYLVKNRLVTHTHTYTHTLNMVSVCVCVCVCVCVHDLTEWCGIQYMFD